MTTQPSAVIGDATLTSSGIAQLANVGRAAVSNWRRRYSDFPTPVGGTPTSPLFDAHEVEAWLRRQGKLHRASTEQWAWRYIESCQPTAQIGDVLGIAGAYLLVRSVQPLAQSTRLLTPKQLVTRLRAFDRHLADLVSKVLPVQWTPQLSTVLRTVEQLGREQEPESAFEYLHSQYVTSAHSMSGLAGTPDSVAKVMLALAGSGASTFDFTCGTGSILRMAADRALRKGTGTHCYAQEIKPEYALIALLRLWFVHQRSQRAGLTVTPPVLHVGDSLLADAFPDLRADVVVANFPFGVHDWGHDALAYDPRWTYGLPPRTEPELAWTQHALAHLSPSGTAVVLMPPAAAARPAGRRIRAELVRRGALRAIIAMPAGLMPPTGVGLHVWVLTQPNPRQPPLGRLLFVDATTVKADKLPDVVTGAWRAYLAGQASEAPEIYGSVPVIDLLDDQVDLTPRRYLARRGTVTADPAQTIAKIGDFIRFIDEVRHSLPAVRTASTATLGTAPQASLVDLIRAGSVSVYRTVSRTRGNKATASDAGIAPADGQSNPVETSAVARTAEDDSRPRIRANDILVPIIGREIVAQVASPEQIGAELDPHVQLVRVDPARFDPWFVAGALSYSDNLRVAGRTSSAAHGAFRIDIRRLVIPVLPLDQQQMYGRAFRQLAEFRAGLDKTAEVGRDLAREIRDGLASGALVVSSRQNGWGTEAW
ncbi:MAG TPA: N-6 DNA methylase [Micromonosporaceae bacterium]